MRRPPSILASALAIVAFCVGCGPEEGTDTAVPIDPPIPDLLPDAAPADQVIIDEPVDDDVAQPDDALTDPYDGSPNDPDAPPPLDATAPLDASQPDARPLDVATVDARPSDVPRVDVPPSIPPGCAHSASGASATWACTSDHASRQRCASAMTETVRCDYGCNPGTGGASATCSCGSHTGFTVWNCLSDGDLHKCQGGAWVDQSCAGHGCSVRPTGTDDVCNPPPPPPGSLSCSSLQWWNSSLTWSHVSYGWIDTDLHVAASTPVQLRHNSRLDRTGVYGWGYMPEFTDQVTGDRFRILHLRPQHQNATTVGRVYPAGFIVGLSGGDTSDTGYPTYSTGAHLCIQTLASYRSAFPTGHDACH